MSFWDDLGKALEDSLKDVNKGVSEARERQQEELKRNLAALGTRGIQQTAREREIDQLISDPEAFNGFSAQQLEHQRLTAQSELEGIQAAIKKQEAKKRELEKEEYPVLMERVQRSFVNSQLEDYLKQARKRTLLIKLIEAKKNTPKKPVPALPPPQPLDPAEIRARKKAEILARLASLPAEEQKMAETTNDEDMKVLIENMYAQKRMELMEELREWL
jgi:hypothetical protein